MFNENEAAPGASSRRSRSHWLGGAVLILFLTVAVSPLVSRAYEYFPIDDDTFWWTWARSDYPVDHGHTTRTWMWGPGGYTTGGWEYYEESPGHERFVQYFDKSRMEINDPYGDQDSPWYVTNGRLAWELMTGYIQMGDDLYYEYFPADIPVAGDPDMFTPTYLAFGEQMNAVRLDVGDPVDLILFYGDGFFNEDWVWIHDDLVREYGVWAEYYVPQTGYTVASVFWEFMNSSGTIYGRDGLDHGALFSDPFYATGYPLTDAYWLPAIPVGGIYQDVLVQCFERRCLSYTPNNPPGWQVEAGNIGQHSFNWRYGE